MTEDCRYCTASFAERDAYVRHLATAHERAELSRVDARLVERREPAAGSGVFGQLGRLLAPFDREDALAVSSMRLPLGVGVVAELGALAVVATLVVAALLAL